METILLVSSVLLWIGLLFNFLLTVALIRRSNAQLLLNQPQWGDVETLAVGQPAPDFSAQALDGNTITLDHYVNRSVALIFTSPTCTPCIERLPSLRQAASRAKQHGVELVLVCDTTISDGQKFTEEHHITLPTLIAPRSNELWQDYMVAGTPFYCLLDEAHKVASTGLMDRRWDTLTQTWSLN